MTDPEIHSLDLHYRHARYENMLIIGTDPRKTLWLRDQIRMFQTLGWVFIIVDLSGDIRPHDFIGDAWSDVERRALQHIANPVIRVHGIPALLSTLHELHRLLQNGRLMSTVVVHFGRVQMTPNVKELMVAMLRQLLAYRTGLWIVAPSINTIPIELAAKLFHTHILFNVGHDDPISYQKWVHSMRLEFDELPVLRSQPLCVFNGRSEGAKGQVLLGTMD